MYLIVDIDHTIRASSWRNGLKGEWDAYHTAGKNDKPVNEMRLLINNMVAFGNHVIACTTIPEKWREFTMDWLLDHGFMIERMWMRPNNDFRSSHEIKVEQIRASGLDPNEVLVIDDLPEVVQAIREAGYTVLQAYVRE